MYLQKEDAPPPLPPVLTGHAASLSQVYLQKEDAIMQHSLEILRLLVVYGDQRLVKALARPMRALDNRGVFELIADVLGSDPAKERV